MPGERPDMLEHSHTAFEPSCGVPDAPSAMSGLPASTQGGSLVKTCVRCGAPRPIPEFREGRAVCKSCINLQLASWRAANAEHCRQYRKDRRAKHGARLNQEHRAWYARNKDRAVRYAIDWARNNPEKARAKDRRRYANNPRRKAHCAAWKKANPERAKQADRIYAAKNAERIAARKREWILANADRIRAQKQRAYALNKDRVLAACREWRRNNPLKARAAKLARRSREASADGSTYTKAHHIAARWEMFGGKCWICGKPATTTDHVIPLSRGGSHWPSNLRPACLSCNSSKQSKKPSEMPA